MIGCIEVKCVAAKPNFPLVPLFAFKGSPSSLRLLDVPKSIGEWEITSVRVVVKYPDNTAFEKSATRTGNVWVATIDGCDTTGKVTNGYEILADGVDENGSEIDGYVLGAGDIYILDRDASVDPDVQKFYVKYCEDIPSNPSKGDLILVDVNANGVTQIKIWNGEEWKSQTLFTKTSQLENDSGFITASAIPSQISAFENDVGYITSAAIPSQISAFENDVGYVTAATLPSNLSDFNNDVGYITASASAITNKRDLDDFTIKGNPQGAGSWFIVNGNALDWYEDQQLWYSNIDGDVIDIIDSGAYMFRVNNYPVGNFTLGDDSTAVIEYDGKTYEIVGYADALAKTSELPSKTSDLVNDSGYVTASAIPSQISAFDNNVGYITASAIPSQISAFENDVEYITASQVKPYTGYSGYARNALGTLFVFGHTQTGLPNENIYAVFDASNGEKLARVERTSYPWMLSMYNGTTFDPPLEMTYGYRTTLIYLGAHNRRITVQVNSNCWVAGSGTTNLYYILATEDENGNAIPDENFYVNGTAHPITFSTNKLSIETIDGETGNITCTRQNTGTYATSLNYYAYEDAIPSNVSQLTNDAGYITASAIPSNVSAFANDAGYLTASSSAFVAKRDKVDMSTYSYAPWTLNGDTYTWDNGCWYRDDDTYLELGGGHLFLRHVGLGDIAIGDATDDALSVTLNYTGGAGEGVLGTATRQSVLYTDGELAKKGYVDAQIYSVQQSIAQTSFTASTALDNASTALANANSAIAALADKRGLMDADVYIYAPWYIEEWEIELDWKDGFDYWEGWHGSPEPDSVELRFSNGTWTLSVNSTEWGTSTAGEKSMQLTFTNGQDTLTLRRSGIYTTGSDVYATEGYVDAQIGTLNTALDTINGEVI